MKMLKGKKEKKENWKRKKKFRNVLKKKKKKLMLIKFWGVDPMPGEMFLFNKLIYEPLCS